MPVKLICFENTENTKIHPLNRPTYDRFDIVLDWKIDVTKIEHEILKRQIEDKQIVI